MDNRGQTRGEGRWTTEGRRRTAGESESAGIRTQDLRLKRPLLYRLSYTPTGCKQNNRTNYITRYEEFKRKVIIRREESEYRTQNTECRGRRTEDDANVDRIGRMK